MITVQDTDLTIHVGDVREVLSTLEDGSVDCVVTSPPYWGLRDYGTGSWAGGDPDCDHLGGSLGRQDAGRDFTGGGGNREGSGNPGKQQFRDVCGKCGASRVDQQLGLEATPDLYVTNMVAVFREVRRVLADHGTAWINLGDSYIAGQGGRQSGVGEMPAAPLTKVNTPRERDDVDTGAWGDRDVTAKMTPARGTTDLKPKDLAGIPWMVAFALRADGWYLRADIIWSKPNPMPESVTDRPTKAHEYVFLLSKRPRYWFDQEAVREPFLESTLERSYTASKARDAAPKNKADAMSMQANGWSMPSVGRNVRSVWEIATQPYAEAHFATYPEELVRRCLLAGCPEWVCGTCGVPRSRVTETDYVKHRPSGSTEPRTYRAPDGNWNSFGDNLRKNVTTTGWSDCGHNNYRPGIVLDPFLGSGTTALVARRHGRRCVGIELNPEYAALAAKRCQQLSLLAG